MVIICEECGKKYNIDPSKIKGKEIKTKCKACTHLIVVKKPEPPAEKRSQDGGKTAIPQPGSEPGSVAEPDPNAETKPIPEPEPAFEPEASPEPHPSHEPEPEHAPAPDSPAETMPPKPPKPEKPAKKQLRPEYAQTKTFRLGITAKLFLMMIIVSLVPLAMFWGITLKQTIERMRNDTVKSINQVSIGMTKQLDEWLDKNVRVQMMFANMDDMISMDRFLQEPLLETIRQVFPYIFRSYSIDLDGTTVASNDDASRGDYSNSRYYQDIIGGKAVAWQVLLDESTQRPALILAVPIKNGNTTVGVLASAMRIDELSRRIVTWEEETGVAFLVDEKGAVIAHKNATYVRKRKNVNRHPLISAFRSGKRGAVSFTNDNGKSSLGVVRDTAFGWILAIQQEEKEAFYIIDQLMSYAYLLLGVTLVFVFIIAWFSGRALSRPLIKLTDAADRISVGELDVEINTKRKDEIGDLSEAVSRMQDSIRLSIERLRKRR